MSLADACSNVLAFMLAFPVITEQEIAMYLTFGATAARMAGTWVRL
jgi:hypothetical protein